MSATQCLCLVNGAIFSVDDVREGTLIVLGYRRCLPVEVCLESGGGTGLKCAISSRLSALGRVFFPSRPCPLTGIFHLVYHLIEHTHNSARQHNGWYLSGIHQDSECVGGTLACTLTLAATMPSATPSPRMQGPATTQGDYFSEATTSKVTLDELRKKRVEAKEHDME